MSKMYNYLNRQSIKAASKKRMVISILILLMEVMILILGIIFSIKALIVIGIVCLSIELLMTILREILFRLIFGFITTRVIGDSMRPSINDGDILFAQRASKYSLPLRAGDIIVIDNKKYKNSIKNRKGKDGYHKYLIKRLVLIGGGSVKGENGNILVRFPNDNRWRFYATYSHIDPRYSFGPYNLKSDEIFFLGDNLFHSCDSRYKEGRSNIDNLYKISDIHSVVVGKGLGEAIVNVVDKKKCFVAASSQIIK